MPTEIWALRLRFSASRLGFERRSWFWAVRLFFEPSSFDCNQQLKKSLHTIFNFHSSQISVLYRIKSSSCLCTLEILTKPWIDLFAVIFTHEEISAQKATMTKMMHQKYLLTVSKGNTYFFAVVIETDFSIHFA